MKPSFERVLKGTDSPWVRNALMTITGSARIVMRQKVWPDRTVTRMLHGTELLSVMGWGTCDFAGTNTCSHTTLCSLAGNAFSGFAVGPVLGAVLPIVFAPCDAHHERCTPRAPAIVSDSSDSE